MSENKIQNEEELWNVLSEEVSAEKKSEPKAPKTEGRFDKPNAPKKGRVDGFFLACMAGVAAVSVAVTLLLSGGGSAPSAPAKNPAATGKDESSVVAQLELENAELRAQLDLQKKQIKDLQNNMMNLVGSEEYLATAPTGSDEGANEVLDAQLEAYQIFAQIQEAFADFDREKLEELIPEMDKRISYLSSDALSSYYMILEYAEQPSNG